MRRITAADLLIMNFIKANLTSIFALFIYIIWWIYILFDTNRTDYENQIAVFISIGLIIVYSGAFLLAASVTKNWGKYLSFVLITLIPLIAMYVMEAAG